ncbi:MAG: ATP-binding cassette domain-containing protein [Hyphomicrobiales bacterium]|nr:ATP-binding cassette domain-containing protein [Hyphomicrobiales bacterium]
MKLDVDITIRRGAQPIKVRFTLEETVAGLYGPSGVGKTTTLQVIAGLLSPDAGHVRLGNRTLTDISTKVFVPAHRRRIGYVFQEGRLFPHFSVAGNLNYGRRFSPTPLDDSQRDAMIDLLGIGHLLKRWPLTLSGGEKQRVAIGRALIAGPQLLLLDEPLASLDEGRKDEMLPFLRRLCQDGGVPIVYVSHDRRELDAIGAAVVPLAPTGHM